MPEHFSDIIILGAGPAGTTAALALAKSGVPCLLIDKAAFPRDKACGDGIGGKALKTLGKIDPGITDRLNRQPFAYPSYGVKFISPDLRSVSICFDDTQKSMPPGYVCRRNDFDNFLLEEVRKKQEVRIIEGVEITDIQKNPDAVLLVDTQRNYSFSCKLLLLAVGNCVDLKKKLNPYIPEHPVEGLGIRTYFENVSGCEPNGSIEIYFLKELLPWYLWIFPLSQGVVNTGMAMLIPQIREKRIVLKNLFNDLLLKYKDLGERFKDAKRQSRWEATRFPYYQGRMSLSGDHFMLLGDTACLIDPFTGEGIGNAVLSGSIAADAALCCVKTCDFSSTSTALYDQEIYRRMAGDLDLGLRLQHLAHNARLLNLVIGKASQNQQVKELISDMLYKLNTKKRLGRSLFYLKLLLNI